MITLHDAAAVRAAEQAHPVELATGALMDRAAHGVAAAVIDLLAQARGGVVGAHIVVLAGTGSNGGDALHAGAKLARRGARVDAIAAGKKVHAGGLMALHAAHGRVVQWGEPEALELLAEADVVIDGLLGIGATGALREPIASIVRATHGLDALIVAVDVPTGVDADSGQVFDLAVEADQTVTFGGLKPGLVVAPGRDFSGGVRLVDIGIGDALQAMGGCLDAHDVVSWVPEPRSTDHKYRRGVVGIAAGSGQYLGAALLATAAASAADIGMVEFLDRGDGVAALVVGAHPPVVASVADPASNTRVSAWAIGPGFAGSESDREAVAAILRCPVPVAVDAGALAVLAADQDLRDLVRDRIHPTVLTPHEGEFARLCTVPISEGRIAAARALAGNLNAIVVLKGSGSVICAPDGTLLVDLLGTPALSTAGSGDVLTGLLGALLAGATARGEVVHDDATVAQIAAAACWLHSEAGRIASEGGLPVSASDIAAALPAAIAAVRRRRRMQS